MPPLQGGAGQEGGRDHTQSFHCKGGRGEKGAETTPNASNVQWKPCSRWVPGALVPGGPDAQRR